MLSKIHELGPDYNLRLFLAKTDRLNDGEVRHGPSLTVGVGSVHKNQGMGLVSMLDVLPAYRGRGIGTSLLQHGMLEAKEMGCHCVVVAAPPSMLSICQKLGFRQFGSVKTYIWHPLSEAKADGWDVVDDDSESELDFEVLNIS